MGTAALGMAAGMLGVAAPTALAAPSNEPSFTDLAVDEVASSENMSLLANAPKSGAFAGTGAFNSDMAFQGDRAYVGNYNGFTIYDISDPNAPSEVAQVLCPGSQNDISVYGDLLFLSTDSSRSDDSCSSESQSARVQDSWEGMKIFDISDESNPEYIKSVATDCGSHTHTLVPGQGEDPASVFLYVSSYSPNSAFPDCQPPHDKISIVEVPVDAPTTASVVSEPVLFPDGGNPGNGYTRATAGCHDITAFPSKDIAAGACMGDGVLMDISDRTNPVVTEVVQDENFAFWHSATFNESADKVTFTDELGGGGAATCNEEVGPERGANAIFDLKSKGANAGELKFASYYKIPRYQEDTENCVAHNGSVIPVHGKDLMVQAWYQGGISVWDYTNSRKPHEIGYLERGPLPAGVLGGSWSAYYYNGYIYSSDIQKGLDVVDIDDKRTDKAESVQLDQLNVQSQPEYGSHPGQGQGKAKGRG